MDVWQGARTIGSTSWESYANVEVHANADNSFSVSTAARPDGSSVVNQTSTVAWTLLAADVDAFGLSPLDALQAFQFDFFGTLLPVQLPSSLPRVGVEFSLVRHADGTWSLAYVTGSTTSTTYDYETMATRFGSNRVMTESVSLGITNTPYRVEFVENPNGYYTLNHQAEITYAFQPTRDLIRTATFNTGTGLTNTAQIAFVLEEGRHIYDSTTVWLNTAGASRVYWVEYTAGDGLNVRFIDVDAAGTPSPTAITLWSGTSQAYTGITVAKSDSRVFVAWNVGDNSAGGAAGDDIIIAILGPTGTSFVSLAAAFGVPAFDLFGVREIIALKNGNVALLWVAGWTTHVTILSPDGVKLDDYTTTQLSVTGATIEELTDGRIALVGPLEPTWPGITPTELVSIILDPRPDTIFGTDLGDFIIGKTGKAETIHGGLGDDRLYTMDGGGNLYGEDGADQLYGGEHADFLYGGAHDDDLFGREGGDHLDGGSGVDEIRGEAGADNLFGGTEGDHLWGGTETDWLWGEDGEDVLEGDEGDDFLYGGANDDDLIGGDGADELNGEAGADDLYGNAGMDILYGGADSDHIWGGAETDLLWGEDGDDFLYGEGGADVFYGGAGADHMDGGTELDSVSYFYSTQRVTIYLNMALTGAGDAQGDTFNSIETFALTNFDDAANMAYATHYVTIWGYDGDDQIIGGQFGSSIIGGAGGDLMYIVGGANTVWGDDAGGPFALDMLSLQFSPGGLSIDMAAATSGSTFFTFLFNGQTQHVYGDVEALLGSIHADSIAGNELDNLLHGNSGNDTLQGRGGVDYLSGGSGDDTLNGGVGADTLDGGADSDTAAYEGQPGGVGILVYLTDATLNGGDAVGDTFISIENVSGTGFNDRIYMDNGVNRVFGVGGAFDTAELYDGADFYTGGSGYDYVLGGGGGDTIDIFSGGGLVYGEAGADTITAVSDSNSLYGGADVDTITGGADQDVIYGGTEGDTLNGGGGGDFIFGESGVDTIHGDAGADNIQGNADGDFLYGDAGVDVITGGDGGDTIEGGADDDFLYGEAGIDTIRGGDNGDQLGGGSEGDFLYGEAGVDILRGDDGDDTLDGGFGFDSGSTVNFLIGGAGNDRLIGSASQEQMWGGDSGTSAGNDTFLIGANSGHDMIFGFEAGAGVVDVINLAGSVVSSYAQLVSEGRIVQAGANTQIMLGAGNDLFLMNMTATSLVADDFAFV